MIDSITAKIAHSLENVDASSWNRLTDREYPFLRHEFLCCLETSGCLGPRTGWTPSHLLFENAAGQLIAAAPMYLKSNSFGEFVFDWSWADAYHRSGLEYYPKLVVAVPFTPATGPRILIARPHRSQQLLQLVIRTAIEAAKSMHVSGLHWLFPPYSNVAPQSNLLVRTGCQFHWHNHEYADFDDFLDTLKSKRRKQIRRERRQVKEAGIQIRRIPGNEVSAGEWEQFFLHYQSTFLQYGNYPALTREFFEGIARTMGEQILLVMASRNSRTIASSFFLVGRQALYGRYWGCVEEIPGLHFEACYYQGIEYCIDHRIDRFEPGAQGEHKISRGFLPCKTASWHWLKNAKLNKLVGHAVERETRHMTAYIAEMDQRSPYRLIHGTINPENFDSSL